MLLAVVQKIMQFQKVSNFFRDSNKELLCSMI